MYIKKYIYNTQYTNSKDYKYQLISLNSIQIKSKIAGSLTERDCYVYKLTIPNLSEKEIIKTLKVSFKGQEETINETATFDIYKLNKEDYESLNLIESIDVVTSNDKIATNQKVKLISTNPDTYEVALDLSKTAKEITSTNNEYLFIIVDNNADSGFYNALMNINGGMTIYIEAVNYQEFSQSTKKDNYSLDEVNINVNQGTGNLCFTMNVLTTHSKSNPINITIVGTKEKVFENENFTLPCRYSFQNKIELGTNEVYIIDALGNKERYYLVVDPLDNQYKNLIIKHEGDSGTVYYNDKNGAYLYYSNNYFKVYDKKGNYAYYENINNVTYLLETKTFTGKTTEYSWEDNLLIQIENDEGEVVSLYGDTNNNVTSIVELNTGKEIAITHNTTSLIFNYLRENESTQITTLTYNTSNQLTKIGNSLKDFKLFITYLNNKVSSVALKLEEIGTITPVEPGPVLPVSNIIETNEVNTVSTLLPTTYTTMEEITYEYYEGYTKKQLYSGEIYYTYYDDLGRKTLEIDNEGKMVGYEYLNNLEQLSTSTLNVCASKLLIENSGFEISDNNELKHWDIEYNNATKLLKEGVYDKTVCFNIPANEEVKLSQTFKDIHTSINKISLLCRFTAHVTSWITLSFTYKIEGSNVEETLKATIQNNSESFNTTWQELTLNLENMDNIIIESGSISISINTLEEQEIYLDDFKINDIKSNRTNLLLNGNMDYDLTSNLNGWEGNENNVIFIEDETLIHSTCLGRRIMQLMNGSVSQTIHKEGERGSQFTLSAFYKCQSVVSINNYAYVKFTYQDDSEEIMRYDLDIRNQNWQVLTKLLVASKDYNKIEVGFICDNLGIMFIDNVQLINTLNKAQYYYDDFGNIIEVLNSNDTSTKINYDANNKVTHISSDNNAYTYIYDTLGRLEKVLDSKGNIVNLTYDQHDNITTQEFVTKDGTSIESYTYEDINNLTSIVDVYGNTTSARYDDYNRRIQDTLPNALTSLYTYTNLDRLTNKKAVIGSNTYQHNLEYLDSGETTKIVASDNTTYNITYDKFGNLLSITMNGLLLNSFEYNYEINDINTGLLTRKIYPNNTSYTFTYDDKKRIKSVDYITTNNTTSNIAIYQYDEVGNISKIITPYQTKYYSYDSSNKLTKIITNNMQIKYYYDNQSNIQKVNYSYGDSYRSEEFDYGYEANKYSLEKYSKKLSSTYSHDVVISGKKGYGTNGLKPTKNTLDDSYNYEDYNLVYKFQKQNEYLSYDIEETNKNLKLSNFNYDKWKEEFNQNKTILLWIKPIGTYNNESLIKLDSASSELFDIRINTSGNLLIKDKTLNTEYASSNKVILDEYNLITISFKEEESSSLLTIYINGTKSNQDISINNTDIKYISICKQDEQTEEELSMPINLLLFSIGKYNQELLEDIDLYLEGIKTLNNSSLENRISNTRYHTSKLTGNYEIYTLNGTLESNRNNVAKITYEEKYNPFEYDNILQEEVYSSYFYKRSKLSIKHKTINKGLISLKFKLEKKDKNRLSESQKSKIYNPGIRSILYSLGLSLYIEGTILKLRSNGSIITIKEDIQDYTWYIVTMFLGTASDGSSEIYVDEELLKTFNYTNETNTIDTIYLGTNESGLTLDGTLKDLVISDNVIQATTRESILKEIINNSYITHQKERNEYGGIINKVIKVKGRSYITRYETNKERVNIEYIGAMEQNRYFYNNMGNIAQIVNQTSEITNTIKYTYDQLGRINTVEDNNIKNKHTYDLNGNLRVREQERKTILGTIEATNYTYDTNNKLIKVIDVVNNVATNYNIEYEGLLNPKTITKIGTNKTTNYGITYEGKRIKSITINEQKCEYRYDEEGRRIRKEVPVYNENGVYVSKEIREYEYDGDKLIREYIIPEIEVQPYTLNGVIDYHYDETGELISFELLNKIYFYIRDILGNIKYIIDETGSIMVKYEYDEWGKCKESYVDTNYIEKYINPFRYKGYYYDKEVEMYWLSSRFYHPIFRRFITIDDIEYLDVEALGSLHLYCYCMNDPVMYSDGSGHFPILCTLLFLGGLGALTSIASQAVTDIMYGNEFDIKNYLIAAGAGFIGGLCYAIPGVGGIVAGAVTSGLTTAGQMIYSGEDYSVADYIINIGMSAAVGGLTSWAFGKATSGLSYFADTDFFLSNLVKFAGNYGGITLQNSVINQLMGQLIVRGVVTGTISNMFGSIFQEIPSKSSDYYHLRKMGLNPWDSFRYAFF